MKGENGETDLSLVPAPLLKDDRRLTSFLEPLSLKTLIGRFPVCYLLFERFADIKLVDRLFMPVWVYLSVSADKCLLNSFIILGVNCSDSTGTSSLFKYNVRAARLDPFPYFYYGLKLLFGLMLPTGLSTYYF